MPSQFHLYLHHSGPLEASWIAQGQEGLGTVSHGSLAEAAAALAHQRPIVWVPAAEVVLTQVALPARQQRRATAIVPYLLEESIAQDIEAMHFALGSRQSVERLPVALVAHSQMQSWLARLNAVGIEPSVMVPEVLGVPYAPGEWTLMVDGQQGLLRLGAQLGLAVDQDNLAFVLKQAWHEQAQQRPTRLRVITLSGPEPDLAGLGTELGLEVVQERLDGPWLRLCADHYNSRTALNLLQGPYSKREQWGKLWKPWRPAAALLLIWLILEAGLAVAEYFQLSREQKTLAAEVSQIYLTTFPETKRVPVGKERELMKRQLEALHKSTASGDSFIPMLANVSRSLQQVSGVELRHIGYKGGVMELALTLPDLQLLDQLKNIIAEQNKFNVEIVSASSRDNRVEARLSIKGAGA